MANDTHPVLCHQEDQLRSISSSSTKDPAKAHVELASKPNNMTAIAVYSIGVIACLSIRMCRAPKSSDKNVKPTSKGVECNNVVVMKGVAFGGGITLS